MLLLAALVAGCSRAHYRESADRETYPIIAEREVSPAYDVGRTHVEPPPGSRLADLFDPDHPPKPPDDPAAALFMDHPDGMHGSKHWGRYGYTDRIEPPGWEQCLGLDQKGVLKLDQDKSVELALLDSREYQTALEDVYLQALTLTLNRFEFDLHWFGRNATTYTHFGTGSFPTETNTLTVNSDLGFTRNFAAGGQLLVDFANALTYEYTGHTSQVRSNIAVQFIQPLLRNFGRQVRLETLTQAERDTLYAVRTFARFRKQFWAGVAVESGGYLDLLLIVQQLRNARFNLKQQEETYRLYYELFRGGRRSVVELDQIFQSLLQARLAVIQSEVGLQNSLDRFKTQLGLPPRIPVELDDSFLGQFVLTDPSLERLRDDLDAFQRERVKNLDQPPPADAQRTHFAALRRLADRLPAAFASAVADLDKWSARLDRPARPGEDPEQRERARTAYADLRKQLPEAEADLKQVREAIERHRAAVADDNLKASWEAITADVKVLIALLDTAIAVQTQSRIYLIELPEVEADEGEAIAYAKQNRLDLQNFLGQVTDQWRKVTVAANQLRGDVNVVVNSNVVTQPGRMNPFAFSADASSYSVGLAIDGPLNRMAERNAYRASLITYQRAKRAYVALSDQVELQIRRDLRQLTQIRLSFEISRQSVLSASRQVENSKLQLVRPGGGGGGPGGGGGGDTVTLNLLQAYGQQLSALNSLVSNYISYEQQRVQLLLDLEALQLDQRGYPANVPTGTARTPVDGPPAEAGERLHAPQPIPPPARGPGGP
jgi:outer membrane protein TolC